MVDARPINDAGYEINWLQGQRRLALRATERAAHFTRVNMDNAKLFDSISPAPLGDSAQLALSQRILHLLDLSCCCVPDEHDMAWIASSALLADLA